MLRTLPSLLLLPLCAAATYAHMHNAWPLNDVGSILTRDPICSLVCCARAAAVYDWQCLKSICCLFSALCAHKSTHNIICYAACCLCMDMSSLCVLSSVIFFSASFLMYLRLCCVNRRSAVPSYFCRYHRLGRFTSGNIRPHTISLLVLFFCFFFCFPVLVENMMHVWLGQCG